MPRSSVDVTPSEWISQKTHRFVLIGMEPEPLDAIYEPTGYKIVRVPFRDGRPQGSYENFMVGFWVSGVQRAEVWGRPAALAVAKDGSLLVADDTGGTIWRIAYTGPQQQSGKPTDTSGVAPRQ